MTAVRLTTDSVAATVNVGAALANLVRPGDVVLLSGDLGAGKTQLAKGLAQGLGVTEPVTSPTFNILLVHQGRIPLYHLDLYRLERAIDLEDIDYFATIEGDGIAVVEWGDKFEEARPVDGVSVELAVDRDESRVLTLRGLGLRGDQLVGSWRAACAGIEGVSVIEAGDAS